MNFDSKVKKILKEVYPDDSLNGTPDEPDSRLDRQRRLPKELELGHVNNLIQIYNSVHKGASEEEMIGYILSYYDVKLKELGLQAEVYEALTKLANSDPLVFQVDEYSFHDVEAAKYILDKIDPQAGAASAG